MFPIIRPVRVFFTLLPYLISFLRDWQRFVLFGPPRVLTREQHKRRARRLTRTLAHLGPAFIKGAQVLGTREDILPREYTDELKTLHDRVPPFSSRQAIETIEESAGKPVSELFEEFDPVPIAAASLGQVHRAVYKGQPVAVKILRPRVEQIVELDLRVVEFLIRLMHLFIESYFIRSFWEIHLEYDRMIHQEMDFRNEESNAERFRRNFANDPYFVVPACFAELTSRRLVVFEFVEGVRVDDPAALAQCGLTPHQLIERLIEGYVRMTIIDGFIHADPHPGNLLVNAEGQIVLLDYGMALDFPDQVRRELLRGTLCIVRDDLDGLVDCFYKLNMVDPSINRALVRDAADTLLKIQFRSDFTPRMIQDIADDILSTFHRFPLRMPQQLVFLFRASALVEGLGMKYDPHFSGVREATPVVKRLMKEVDLGPGKVWYKEFVEDLKGAWATARRFRAIIHRMEREEQRIRFHQGDLDDMKRFLGIVARRLMVGGLALVGLLSGVALYAGQGHFWWMLALGVPSAAVFFSAFILPMRKRDRLR